jgi:hypothetical protein
MIRKQIDHCHTSLISSALTNGDDAEEAKATSVPSKAYAKIKREAESEKRKGILEAMVKKVDQWRGAMAVLVEEYFAQITSASLTKLPLLTVLQAKKICSNGEQVLAFYELFADDLTERLAAWEEKQTLTDIFSEKKTELKLFYAYANKRTVQTEALDEAKENQELTNLILKLDKKLSHQFFTLIELPLKTIPELLLFVQEFVQHSSFSEDYDELCKVFNDLKSLSEEITKRCSTDKAKAMLGTNNFTKK